MSISLAQLHKHLTGDTLRPVYLLAGEEHLLLLEAADAIRVRARALGFTEREVIDLEANGDWNELSMAASAMSLFATRKVIDLRLPSGKPGKDGAAAIIEYCENPPPDTVLLITSTQWGKAHETAWVAALEKVGLFVPCWPIKLGELPAWIEQRLASRGLKANRDAAAVLAERVEGNLLAAAQEIDKLVLLRGAGTVDVAAMEDLVADSARFDAFKLTDAACAGDAERCLRVLAGLRAEGEQVPPLLGWILNQLQLLARLSAQSANLSAAFSSERVWPARQGMYRKALGRSDRSHWERCLRQATRIDRISKGRGAGDAWLELERLLVAMAQPRAARLLAS